MSRGDDGAGGGSGAGGGDAPREGLAEVPDSAGRTDSGDDEPADRVEHVEVRRARPPAGASVFGDTPIAGPRLPEPEAETDDEPGETEDLAAWVRKAALVAALRAGAQACVVGVFMGIVLGFFLSGMMPGVGLLLGLVLTVGAFPVSILAGIATYRQTLETERTRQGLCPHCGYDLRGLNTARCPECGTKLRPARAWAVQSDSPGQEDEHE